MTMRKKRLFALADLLNTVEDFYSGGFRRTRKESCRQVSGRSDVPLIRDGIPVDRTESVARKKKLIEKIAVEVAQCNLCDLHVHRRNTVPGEGVLEPLVVVVGEGPGVEEDQTGRPFIGPAGKYLDKWLKAIGLSRNTNCFIGNVVKCRPPGNRDPEPDESSSCLGYLRRQITILQPKAIFTVGRISTRILTEKDAGISTLRGRVHEYHGTPLVPTFHPSAVLRNTDLRRLVWTDLRLLRSILDNGG